MYYSLNSLKEGYVGDYEGLSSRVTEGDIRSLDYSSSQSAQLRRTTIAKSKLHEKIWLSKAKKQSRLGIYGLGFMV